MSASHLIASFVQLAVMIGGPLVVAAALRAKRAVSWSQFGYGAIAFIASQCVHIPLLWVLPHPRPEAWSGALVLGLLAGLCEETARLVMYRTALRRTSRWHEGVMAGMGHGGCESILLGIGVAAAFVSSARPHSDGTPAIASLFASMSAGMHLLSALERIDAVTIHVLLSLLVMRAVTRSAWVWYACAVLLHTAVDATAAFGVHALGVVRLEAVVTGMACVCAAGIFLLRDRDPPAVQDAREEVARAGESPLACFGLTKRYDDRVAADSIELRVARGEIVALLGPNGAGKTTTVRMLCGLIAPSSGTAVVAGTAVGASTDEAFRSSIGIAPETPGLYERLTAEENLDYYGRLYGLDTATRRRRIESLLRTAGLWERRGERVSGFSKGMKQKVALARALLHEPQVLFLDEPSSGLDPEASIEVRRQIRAYKTAGTTVLLTTHRLEEAEELADRIGILQTKLLAMDSVANLRAQLYAREVSVRLVDRAGEILDAIRSLDVVRNARVEGPCLVVSVDDPDRDTPVLVRAIVGAGGGIVAVEEVKHSLEDVYLHILHGAQ